MYLWSRTNILDVRRRMEKIIIAVVVKVLIEKKSSLLNTFCSGVQSDSENPHLIPRIWICVMNLIPPCLLGDINSEGEKGTRYRPRLS